MDLMDDDYDNETNQAEIEALRAEIEVERAKPKGKAVLKPKVEAEPEDEVTVWTGTESFSPESLPVVKLSARGIPTHTEDGDILSADARWRLM